MPFFGQASSPEVNGGKFWDVEGDLNEYQHDDYSIQMSGQGNVVTQVNRPAMISTQYFTLIFPANSSIER
jgi:hypothetical protein